MPKDQKGFFQIIFIIILLIGIAIAVYLSQFTQIFKPKANTPTYLQKVDDAAFEPFYNPFGDPWGWKKPPNPYIPQSIGIPSYHALGPKGTTNEIPEREIEFLSRSNTPILYMDSAALQLDTNPATDPEKLEKLKNLISRLKARGVKVIGYTVAQEGGPFANWIVEYANNNPPRADEQGLVRPEYYESFLVHKKGVPKSQYSPSNRLDGRPDPNNPNKLPAAIFDITNPEYRRFIIPKMVEAMRSMELGGVLMDGVFYNSLQLYGVQSPYIKVPGNEVPDEIAAAWPGALAIFTQELKTAMGNELLLFANVQKDQPLYASNDLLRPGRLDGIMLEDPIGRSEQVPGGRSPADDFRPGQPAFENMKTMLQTAKDRDKYVMVIVNTNVNCQMPANLSADDTRTYCFRNTNETWEKRYASYYLSAFLLMFQSPKQFLVYYTPTNAFYQFFSETFFREWDLDIGNPIASIEPVPGVNGVYVRKFERGYVYLNTTYDNRPLPNTGNGIYDTVDGTEVNKATIPAKSGRIFVTRAVLDNFNNPPPPPPSPSPSSLPTFTLNRPTVSCIGNTASVNLSWTPLPDNPTYQILVRKEPGTVETKVAETSQTTFNIPGFNILEAGSSYGFIIAVNTPSGTIYSNGAWSDRDHLYGWTKIPDCSSAGPSPTASSSPTASLNPSSSPISSSSPNRKPGDTDDDNDIDIFDYNLVVTHFGKTRDPNTKADLDNDDDVDIFDYNLLVTNFGR